MVTEISKETYNQKIDGAVVYGLYGTTLVPLKLNADGELVVNLESATLNIGDVDIASPVGDQAKAASISVTPATDITDGRYIGDIKFGEALPTGENHAMQVGGHVSVVTGTLTRPADTPGAYSAKDEINSSTTTPTVIEFANVARVNAGTGTIVMVHKKVNNAGATAQLRLHLYNAAPTPANDHASFTQMWADRAKYIGYVDFGPPVVEGTGSDMAMVQVPAVNMPFVCAAASRNLYGRVEVIVAGAAPAASQVWNFVLRCLVD